MWYRVEQGFIQKYLLGGGTQIPSPPPPLTDHTKGQFSDTLEDVQFEEVLEIIKRKNQIKLLGGDFSPSPPPLYETLLTLIKVHKQVM